MGLDDRDYMRERPARTCSTQPHFADKGVRRMRYLAPILLAGFVLATVITPATAQRLGKGSVGVDETTEMRRCDRPVGTIALVEEQNAATLSDELPPGMRALVRLAEAQNGKGGERIDPLPLLKLLTAQLNCFQVLDRG